MSDVLPHGARLPRLPGALLRALLPRAERDELLADIRVEYAQLARSSGPRAAQRWLWGQTLHSAPSLLRWSWRRSRTGFEPSANAFRPGDNLMKHFLADARYASRRLRSRPAYTLLAVLTLALGIGGTAAVFGVARPLIFDPLPYAHASEDVVFWRSGWWNEEEFTYLRDKFAGFTAVGMYRPGDVTMREGDSPARLIPGIAMSWELFDVLGARPFMGRPLQRGDDVPGAEPVALISYGLWQELGGAPTIIGRRLMLDGTPRTVVGVMPRNFWFPSPDIRIWTARAINPQGRNGSYTFVGRVAPGQDVHNMAAPVNQLTKVIGERFRYGPKADKTKDAAVKPIREELLGKMRPAVVATFAAMSLILLIACVNVAALMLGQVEGRASELAVRSALGATRRRITQQLVVEALLLGVLAGAVGAGLAVIGFRMLAQSLPIGAWAEVSSFDWSLFVVALGVALLAVLLVVVVPLVSLRRADLRGALSGARTGGIQGRGGRLERGLVVAEVALAMLIATGAAVLVRSVSNLYAINPGIDTKGVAVVDILSSSDLNGDRRIAKIDEIVAAAGQLPGVRAASASMKIPLRGGGNSFGTAVEGRPTDPASLTLTYFRVVSPDYFTTVGMRVRSGRGFEAQDIALANDTTQHVLRIVVNETLVKKYFPGENPIGRRLVGGFGWPQEIIGVVPDAAEAALTDEPTPTAYYLHTNTWFGGAGSVLVRTNRPEDAEAILDDLRRTVQRVAPEFAVQGTTTMERVFAIAVGPARQIMSLLSLLSALALILGAIGIYGVISHFAARRQRDWAIRVALGLPGARVITHIVRQGVILALVGVVIGAIGAAALTRALATFLFGVSSIDPVAFAAASAALIVIGMAAALIPARRAGTVDPALVLREQ